MSDVLVFRAGALGDILLLRVAVAAIRRGGHRVSLLAPRESGSALVGPGPSEVDSLVAWDRADMAALLVRDRPMPRTLAEELERFELVVAYTRNADLVANLGTLVERVIAHDPQPNYDEADARHASIWLASALASLGVAAELPPPPCQPTSDDEKSARPWTESLPRGFLAVHPGSGSREKNWPAKSFADFVEEFRGNEKWLLVEGPADRAQAEGLRHLPGALPSSDLPPRTLGAILSRAGVFLGNDSGVSHLAAAWGAPTVALFGPTDPAIWAPIGPRVRVLRGEGGSMSGIAVHEVVTAARDLIY